MIKTLLMYSILVVTSFIIGWLTQDFHYTIVIAISITVMSYFLYDEWIKVLKMAQKKTLRQQSQSVKN
ncbi:hypothetical protein [Staphylococcus pseudoxylosus]|uniref:hypothetical protein n=1 Tax=Staphylococcus pseudoxylosus TaxID=2282419 RepID=UPI003F573302